MSPGPNPDYCAHFSAMSEALPGTGVAWVAALRQKALAHFDAHGFPSPRDEEWRYTNVSAIEKKRFKPRIVATEALVDSAELNRYRLAGAWSLVFVDGHFAAELSDLDGLPEGVAVTSLGAALARPAAQVEAKLGRVVASSADHGFVSFNTAFFSDGLFLHVPAGTVLSKPVQIINVSAQTEAATNVRNLIILESGAQAELVETHVASETTGSMAVSITEIVLEESAALTCHTLHGASERAFRFGGLYVDVGRSARFDHTNLTLGGLLVRNEIHVDLAEAAECSLDGLFIGQNRRHVDNHTLIRHNAANGTSRENYRGVLTDRSRGVFQGRIVVQPQAQKTDAQMSNRNLLLSDDAEIDTKPQLEIHADDVKCAHGVTVGQLDPESIFYLESRGVDPLSARNMLTFAFANAMVDGIRLKGFRELAQDALLSLFPQAGIRKDWL
jgi:Fe-S cluster assembly protein SufD